MISYPKHPSLPEYPKLVVLFPGILATIDSKEEEERIERSGRRAWRNAILGGLAFLVFVFVFVIRPTTQEAGRRLAEIRKQEELQKGQYHQ